jgi:glycosyltransferase involved in cell wall biosynthesis
MERPLSVLHVTQPTEGGVSQVVLDLAADQVRRGLTVTVASPDIDRFASSASEVGVAHERWAATRAPGISAPGETARLSQIVRDLRPGLVHLHSSKAGLAGRVAIRGRLPTVFQPHAWSFLVGGSIGAAALRWERWGARYSHAIVCVSKRECELGHEAGIRGRFVVIPNGVDLVTFSEASEAQRREARAHLGLPECPLAVCIGRLSRQKGQDVLLEGWPWVVARVPDARLVLVGDGPDREQLVAAAGDDVLLVGDRNDIPEWLAAADVVVLPSRWEGMSLTMIEAMARGRSVVATDVAGAREALGAGGGDLVPVEEPQALARALAERLLDPSLAAKEGRAGRRTAQCRHDVRRSSDAVAQLYGQLV